MNGTGVMSSSCGLRVAVYPCNMVLPREILAKKSIFIVIVKIDKGHRCVSSQDPT